MENNIKELIIVSAELIAILAILRLTLKIRYLTALALKLGAFTGVLVWITKRLAAGPVDTYFGLYIQGVVMITWNLVNQGVATLKPVLPWVLVGSVLGSVVVFLVRRWIKAAFQRRKERRLRKRIGEYRRALKGERQPTVTMELRLA